MSTTLAFRYLCLACWAGSVFALVWWSSHVPALPQARLGRRGIQRRLALEAGSFQVLEPLLRFLAAALSDLPLGRLRQKQELELRRADYFWGLTADEYSALSLVSGVGLGAAIAGVMRLADGSAIWAIPAAALGLILPSFEVQGILRTRAKQITRGLPHAIEIAALCMGAGLDFPGALRLLSKAQHGERSALADEFSAILEELELGHTRTQALLSFAERVPTQAVRDFVAAVVQAEQRGNPLAQVIQIQGRVLQLRRSVAAEEAAARAGVLMILPLVLLVGCVMLLLMGPLLAKGMGF